MPVHGNPIVLLWTSGALLGVLINLWAMGDAMLDLQALRASGLNGAREIVAKGNIRREAFRIFKQGCFLAVGLYFLWLPPVPGRTGQGPSAASVVLVTGLLLASFSMDLGALIDRRERIRLIAYINRHLAADAARSEEQ